MKRKNIFKAIPLVLSIFLLVGISINKVIPVFAQNNVDETVQTEHDLAKLDKVNVKLKVSKEKPAIDRKTAEENARKAFEGFTADAKTVTVEYHSVTNNSFQAFSEESLKKNEKLKNKGYMEDIPAYIVSFKGVEVPSLNPEFSNDPKANRHEFNVIVDAMSGEPLMAFCYQ